MSMIIYGGLVLPVVNGKVDRKAIPTLKTGMHGSCFGAIYLLSPGRDLVSNGRFFLSSNWTFEAMTAYVRAFREAYKDGFKFPRVVDGRATHVTLPRPSISVYSLNSTAKGHNAEFASKVRRERGQCYVGLTFDKGYDANEFFVAFKMFGKTACSPIHHGYNESEMVLDALKAGVPVRALQILLGWCGGAANYQFPAARGPYSWYGKDKLKAFLSNEVFEAKGMGRELGSLQDHKVDHTRRGYSVNAPVFNWYSVGDRSPQEGRVNNVSLGIAQAHTPSLNFIKSGWDKLKLNLFGGNYGR